MSAASQPEIERLTGQLSEQTAPEWSSVLWLQESVDELGARLRELCQNAVDPLEIAAGLEADGMSDQASLTRYGFPDVFALAEELYQRTTRAPAEPPPAPNPWRAPVGRHVLHGLLFSLPALCYPVAAPVLAGRDALLLLVASMLVSWPISQGLSHLGYTSKSRNDIDGARRLLRIGLLVGVLTLGIAVLPLELWFNLPVGVLGFAVGQGGYLCAATVLLVLGADWWLAAALAPGALVAAAYLLTGQPGWLHPYAWLALGLTLALALGFGVWRTTWPRPEPAKRPMSRQALFAATPAALFGLLVIGLLVFPLLLTRLGHSGSPAEATAMLGTLPLSLSMGAAEWQLYRYRGGIHRLLQRTRRPSGFATGSRLLLGTILLEYLAATAVLIAATVGLAALAGKDPQWTQLLDYAGYLALGGALFLGLLLQVCRGTGVALGWCLGALLAEIALAVADHNALALRIQLVTSAGLLVVLAIHGGLRLSRVSRHLQ